jgi:hypothetical protein
MIITNVVTDNNIYPSSLLVQTALPLRCDGGSFEVNMSINKLCEVCGKQYKCSPSEESIRRTCSRECNFKLRIKREYVTFNGYRYFKDHEGYYIKRKDGRSRLHRDKWEHYRGVIPKGFFIHHKNHNKSDNRLCNLEPMERGEHSKYHNVHKTERKCDLKHCNKRHVAKGLCSQHYEHKRYKDKIGETK